MSNKIDITALVDTIAKKKPVNSKELPDSEKTNVKAGEVWDILSAERAVNNHVEIKTEAGVWFFYAPHVKVSDTAWYILSTKELQAIVRCNDSLIERYHAELNKAMFKYDITTLPRVAAFIAQVAHESGGLRYSEEIASGAQYNGRHDLGNHLGSNYGVRYKGRGLIQLTGYYNYKKYGTKLGVDLVQFPHLAATPRYAAEIAAAFWDDHGLNKYADQNSITAFRSITRIINGGYNGWEDRRSYWLRAKTVLHLL